MKKDISEIKNELNNLVNELLESYSNILHEKTVHSTKNNNDILFLNNQNKLQMEEIKNLEKNILELNRKCNEYEIIIIEIIMHKISFLYFGFCKYF